MKDHSEFRQDLHGGKNVVQLLESKEQNALRKVYPGKMQSRLMGLLMCSDPEAMIKIHK